MAKKSARVVPRKGRPSLGKVGKSPRITFSVDDARRSRWEKAAEAAGFKSLSAWLRKVADDAASRP